MTEKFNSGNYGKFKSNYPGMKRRTTGNKKRRSTPGNKTYTYDGKRKFKKTGASKLVLFQNVSACPDRLMLKMKWTGVYNLAPGTTISSLTFYANSIFDPSGTVGTDQPISYNEWKVFYGRYRVYGVKWIVNSGSTAAAVYLHITITPSRSSSAPSNIATALEQPRAVYLGLHEVASRRSHKNQGYWSTSEIIGVNPQQVRDDDVYASSFTTSPTRQWYIHMNFGTSDGTTLVLGAAVVQLIYYVELFDRLQLTASAG